MRNCFSFYTDVKDIIKVGISNELLTDGDAICRMVKNREWGILWLFGRNVSLDLMKPSDIVDSRILFSALDWGWGHVSRGIGLLDEMAANRNDLFIACNQAQRDVFELYFPSVTFIDHDGYDFNFRGKGNFTLDMLRNYKRLKKRQKKELSEVDEYINKHKIDYVISDHRYAFRSKDKPSFFITHQLNLPVKWWQKSVQLKHQNLMTEFTSVWVPDTEDQLYSGKLSNDIEGLEIEYMGPKSRFSRYSTTPEKNGPPVIIASGPTVYAQQLVDEFVLKYPKAIVICEEGLSIPQGHERISGNWLDQDSAIIESSFVVSRSGYSTIMDLVLLGTPHELIPTPGQAEQIFLSKRIRD